ncbi:hypothetical protein [Haladaptatus sp. DJG-WS-42]|uniref:hypothetical protein n=1 Tax=Haladaptatus sp. DJG-WS-42 TaxID=3120516 RepID=UPI0030D2DB89
MFRRNSWVLLFLLVIGGGLIVGTWNQQEIQTCHDMYDDDPTVAADCEDSFTDVVYYGSLFSVSIGIFGVLWSLLTRAK